MRLLLALLVIPALVAAELTWADVEAALAAGETGRVQAWPGPGLEEG